MGIQLDLIQMIKECEDEENSKAIKDREGEKRK
jgi:hypothetical protein